MRQDARRVLLRRVLFVLSLVIAALIFFFSSQEGEESSGMSQGITRFLLQIFVPDYEVFSSQKQAAYIRSFTFFVRKGAHFTEFGVLAFVLLHYLRLRLAGGSLPLSGLLAWAVATLYAGTDEWHQMFVSGRDASLRDVCVDSAGALTGVLLAVALQMACKRRKRS